MRSTLEVVVLECPQCGKAVQKDSNVCPNCFSEYMVRSVSGLGSFGKAGIDKYLIAYKKTIASGIETAELQAAMGICYLKLGLHDFAIKAFDKAIGYMPEDSEVYCYAAISLFKGKRPFLSLLSTVRKAFEYMEVALSLSEEGRYYYLMYLIQKDYFDMKRLKNEYNSDDLLSKARKCNVVEDEIHTLLEYVPVP